MARELGMNPGKFEGIVGHIQEQSTQSLAEFIETEYVRRYGKTEPDDRRSIEQKLKAEHAMKEQKLMLKATTRAVAKWEALPESVRAALLENIWCDHCEKKTTIIEMDCQMINSGLIVSGKCATCGNAVGGYVE